MATIRDVAKASGVSIATVSHVLNGRQGKVSEETRERVLAAVRELRYRPTPLEDKQKAILTHNIGFLASDLATSPIRRNQYFGLILDSVIEAAALRGYSTTIFVERMWDDVGRAIRRSYDGRCDGVLLLAPSLHSEAVRTLWERGTPLVSIGTTAPLQGISYVDIDNEQASLEITRHLLELGHRKIGFIGGNVMTTSAIERAQGYFEAMAGSGAPPEDVAVVVSRGTAPEWDHRPRAADVLTHPKYPNQVFELPALGSELAQFMIREALPDVTALVCWNDGVAREAITGLRGLDLSVPDQVSVASFDDSSDATAERPYLTSVRQPFHLIGRTAVNILVERIKDHKLPDQAVRFTPELVVRESTQRKK